MELVEFMSNKERVVETFKVNGLIAKDNTVTEKGLMAIQFYKSCSLNFETSKNC